MANPPRTLPARHLWRGLFISASITLGFLAYAHYSDQPQYTKDIAVMGLIVAIAQTARYLCFFDPWLDEEDRS